MDESTRGLLAQAMRDALASCGIDHDEGYIDSIISQIDNDGKSSSKALIIFVLTLNKSSELM